MDLNEIWQEHKGFILGVTASAVVFLVAKSCVVGVQKDGAEKQLNSLRTTMRKVGSLRAEKIRPPGVATAPKGPFSSTTRSILELEAGLEQKSFEVMWQASAFQRRAEWPFGEGIGFIVPESAPQPGFICDETAAALDSFWRRNLATTWTGKSFSVHRGEFEMTTRRGEVRIAPPERFLIALDLSDRVLHLAAHHRLGEIRIQKIHQRDGFGSTARKAREDDLLQAAVAVDFAFRAPSLAMRIFLQDLLAGEGETLARNARGEDRVAVDRGANASDREFFKRVGEPWPLQLEIWQCSPQFEEEGSERATVRTELTLVARILRPLPKTEEDE